MQYLDLECWMYEGRSAREPCAYHSEVANERKLRGAGFTASSNRGALREPYSAALVETDIE